MSVTIAIRPDTRRQKDNGTYPIKMWVTYKRKAKPYQTIFDLSEKDYEKLSSPNINVELREIRQNLKAIQKGAEDCIDEMSSFSFAEFEKRFILNNPFFKGRKLKIEETSDKNSYFDYSPYAGRFKIFEEKHVVPDCLSAVYLPYIKKKIRIGKVTTAIHYQTSYFSIKKFKGDVCFKDVTPDYCAEYLYWMTSEQKNSRTTASMYLRTLRTIYNEAIDQSLAKKDSYPFGKRRFSIPAGRKTKRALTEDDIKAIYYYETDCPKKKRARDMWLFMYLGNGMNPKDVALLRFKNIKGDFITFDRAKVEDTSESESKTVTFYISDDIKQIIKRWGNIKSSPDSYIFPILEDGLNPLQESFKIDYFVATNNKWMRKVFDDLKIDKKSNTIVARHSVATHLKRLGASTEYIQESLGHSSKKTTEIYLGSFENEIKKDFSEKLLGFKKIRDDLIYLQFNLVRITK